MKYVIIRNDTDELYHHGVKGMKWGRRKAQYTSSTSSKFSTGHNKIASMLGNNGKKQVSDSYKRVQITKSNYKQAKKDFNKLVNSNLNQPESATEDLQTEPQTGEDPENTGESQFVGDTPISSIPELEE